MGKQRITGCLYYGCGVGRLEWSADLHVYREAKMKMKKTNMKKRLEDMMAEELEKRLEGNGQRQRRKTMRKNAGSTGRE